MATDNEGAKSNTHHFVIETQEYLTPTAYLALKVEAFSFGWLRYTSPYLMEELSSFPRQIFHPPPVVV